MQRLVCFLGILLLSANAMGKIADGAKKIAPKQSHAVVKKPLQLIKDTSTIKVKAFNHAAIKSFKADKDFNYNDYAGAGEPSFWQSFWEWVKEHLFGWIYNTRYGGQILQYVLLAAGIGLIVFVVFRSLGIDPIQLFRGNSRDMAVAYSESVEDINRIDFDAEIEKALAQNNYRLAVRLLYLRCLKQLSDSQLIHWQIDKTNSAYVNELVNPAQKQAFGVITRQFEYVWYGNFSIDKQAYTSISGQFQDFKQTLS